MGPEGSAVVPGSSVVEGSVVVGSTVVGAVTGPPEANDVVLATTVVAGAVVATADVVAGAAVVLVGTLVEVVEVGATVVEVVEVVDVVEVVVVDLMVVVLGHEGWCDAVQTGTAPWSADACIGSRNAAPASSELASRVVELLMAQAGAPLSARKMAHSVLTAPDTSGLSFARSPFDENTT